MASSLLFLVFIALYPSYNLAQNCAHGTCTIECIGEDACKAASLQCNPNYACTVICNGKAACSDAIISGNTANQLSVHCQGENACKSASIECASNHKCLLNCEQSYKICDGIDISLNSALSFQCFNQCPAYVLAQVYTQHPTTKPSIFPTPRPTKKPTSRPTTTTTSDTTHYTTKSTVSPTKQPSTMQPTNNPIYNPTKFPTSTPSQIPTVIPTGEPPTKGPTQWVPTQWPWPIQTPLTKQPTKGLTQEPTKTPTQGPTNTPSKMIINNPSHSPTNNPITSSTIASTMSTKTQTTNPSLYPTATPTHRPTTETPTVSTTVNNTTDTSTSTIQTTVSESNCSTLRLSTLDSMDLLTNVSTYAPDSRISHTIVAKLSFNYQFTANEATNIVEIVTGITHDLIHDIIPLNCFNSDVLNTQYLLTSDDMIVDLSIFVCDEQQQLLKYALDTNTNEIICHIIRVIHQRIQVHIPINVTSFRSDVMMIYKDRVENTSVIALVPPDRDGNILHGVHDDYYGKHGNHLQITLLVIAGILAVISIIVSICILILSSKKLRERVKHTNDSRSATEDLDMRIAAPDDGKEIAASEVMVQVHSASKHSPQSGYVSTLIIERKYQHCEGHRSRRSTEDTLSSVGMDMCDINGVWITRSAQDGMSDGYMLNHSAYDISPSTNQPYELNLKRAIV
eukprot:861375_1